jgi:hypothetical protein
MAAMAAIPAQVRHPEEFARLGDEIYERSVLPHAGPDDQGRFVAIDIVSGDYEIDRDELAATDRLRARHPDAQIWLRRIGSRYTHRFGARPKTTLL